MVVCVSEPYLHSKPCQLELEYGFKKDLPLIGEKLGKTYTKIITKSLNWTQVAMLTTISYWLPKYT